MAKKKKKTGSMKGHTISGGQKRPTKKGAGKSFCARSGGQMKKFPKAANDPNSRLRQARKRWKC